LAHVAASASLRAVGGVLTLTEGLIGARNDLAELAMLRASLEL